MDLKELGKRLGEAAALEAKRRREDYCEACGANIGQWDKERVGKEHPNVCIKCGTLWAKVPTNRESEDEAAIAEKQRYDIRVEDKMAMLKLAKSTESLVSMLSNRGDHHEHEAGIDLILMAMRVAYRLGVDAGRNLPLR